jgi:putative heme-binding domain-containing protein
MAKFPRAKGATRFSLYALLIVVLMTTAAPAIAASGGPKWIWCQSAETDLSPTGICYFRKTVEVLEPGSGSIEVAAESFELFLNGTRVGQGQGIDSLISFDVSGLLKIGKNTIAIRAAKVNRTATGLAAKFSFTPEAGRPEVTVTDETWKASARALPLWNRSFYSDGPWKNARTIALFGESGPQNPNIVQPEPPASKPVGAQIASDTATAVASGNATGPVDRKIAIHRLSTPPFKVPDEFAVQHVASNEDVGSAIAMTFNEFGQLVVSRENGPLLLIYDVNQDGQFDTVRECSDQITNAQGILALNGNLYVTGQGPDGVALYRLDDNNKDGFYEAAAALVKFKGQFGEHGPHGVVLGPDGLLYVMVGNHAAVDGAYAESSPYRHAYEGELIPRFEDPGGHANGIKAPGGIIIRTDLAGTRVELFAGGLRNPYDLAFDAHGQLFTHDSDMESDEGTTWYAPTRILHVVAGAEFGWRSGWARWPEYYIDSLPAVVDTRRGSPAGMVFFDHDSFPDRYRNALFSCDWSSGKILVMRCVANGASFHAKPETFVQGEPLNATDIEVGPDGWLYFCTGGRNTQGNIFRVVRNEPRARQGNQLPTIEAALRQSQPLSAWARQNVAAIKAQLGPTWDEMLLRSIRDVKRTDEELIRALDIMVLFGPAPSTELVLELSRSRSPDLAAKSALLMCKSFQSSSASGQPDRRIAERLVEMLTDASPHVRRCVCDALAEAGQPVSFDQLVHILASDDAHEAWAARKLLERLPVETWQNDVIESANQRAFLQGATAMMIAAPSADRAQLVIRRGRQFMEGFIDDRNFIDLLRVFQLAIHRGGLEAGQVPELAEALAEEYPASDHTINRELVRLLVCLEVSSIMPRYLSELARSDLPPAERLHLATHLTFLKSGFSRDDKFKVFQYLTPPANSGNSVPGYLQNVAQEFGRQLTADEAKLALANGDRWPAAALAAALQMPEKLNPSQIAALKQLDQKLLDSHDDAARRLKVVVVAILARDGSVASLDYLRTVFDTDETRRVEVAYGLAEHIDDASWPYLIRSLPFLDNAAARHVLVRLRTVTRWPNASEPYREVIRAAERLEGNGADDAVALLEHWRGFAPSQGTIPWNQAIVAWKRWYSEEFPNDPLDQQPAQVNLASTRAVAKVNGKWNYDQLRNHLLRSEQQNSGSAAKGRQVYVKANCAKCHRIEELGDSMGPVLTNLAQRFRTAEILESIVYPSKTISDQYHSKVVVTSDGKTYAGIVAVMPSDQIAILQPNGQKAILQRAKVDSLEPSSVSAMPEGLLDSLSVDEIVDLFAFLRSASSVRMTSSPATTRK